jgi:hypothetical protein
MLYLSRLKDAPPQCQARSSLRYDNVPRLSEHHHVEQMSTISKGFLRNIFQSNSDSPLKWPDVNMTTPRSARSFPVVKEVRTFLIEGVGSGGDYHNVWFVQLPHILRSQCVPG